METQIRDLLHEKKQCSTRTIARALGVTRRKAHVHLSNGPFEFIVPCEVGSGKRRLNVWKITS